MGSKNSTIILIGCFLICLLAFSLPTVQAQDYRLSASYNIKSVGFNYVPNQTFNGEIGAVSKGVIEVELERYLFYRFYVASEIEYLLHNQGSFLVGGPVDFQQINLGASLGLQFPKFGIYGGVKAGRVWDFKIRATDFRTGDGSWVEPIEPIGQLTASLSGGVKYYLLNFVRLQAEISQGYNLPQDVVPQSSFTENPAFRSFDFSPIAFSVGVSVSIPWNRPAQNKNNEEIKLPPLMRVSGINFSTPLKDTFITSEFGPRWNNEHKGVDLDAGFRDKILAAEQGVVVKAGNGRGYGKMVRIKHTNGYETIYAHMSRISVKEGDRIRKGDLVGRAGNTGTSTGVHLHFEIIKDGVHVNPLSYIRF